MADRFYDDESADIREYPETSCTFVLKNGQRCDRTRVEGDTLCIKHGGSLVLAKESAQRRLYELLERSMRIAEELFDFSDEKVKASIMFAVWDRVGLSTKHTTPPETDMNLTSEEMAERLEAQAAKLRLDAREKQAAKFRVETQEEQAEQKKLEQQTGTPNSVNDVSGKKVH